MLSYRGLYKGNECALITKIVNHLQLWTSVILPPVYKFALCKRRIYKLVTRWDFKMQKGHILQLWQHLHHSTLLTQLWLKRYDTVHGKDVCWICWMVHNHPNQIPDLVSGNNRCLWSSTSVHTAPTANVVHATHWWWFGLQVGAQNAPHYQHFHQTHRRTFCWWTVGFDVGATGWALKKKPLTGMLQDPLLIIGYHSVQERFHIVSQQQSTVKFLVVSA